MGGVGSVGGRMERRNEEEGMRFKHVKCVFRQIDSWCAGYITSTGIRTFPLIPRPQPACVPFRFPERRAHLMGIARFLSFLPQRRRSYIIENPVPQ